MGKTCSAAAADTRSYYEQSPSDFNAREPRRPLSTGALVREATWRNGMLRSEKFLIDSIYVPTKRRTTLDRARVDAIAESMLENGQTTPIMVRPDGARFVLIEGLHRLEAAKALGEKTIVGFRVDARKH
jgi:sulfiredoxin